MGVLDRFKEKLNQRKEKQKAVYFQGRRERLAALKNDRAYLQKKKQERKLRLEVKNLQAEERKAKLEPYTAPLKGAVSGFKSLAKKAADRQKLAGTKKLAEQRQSAMFGDAGKKELFEVRDPFKK